MQAARVRTACALAVGAAVLSAWHAGALAPGSAVAETASIAPPAAPSLPEAQPDAPANAPQAPKVTLTLTHDSELADVLRGASLIFAAEAEGRTDAQDIFAAAQADYARLVAALYARGRYGGSVSIRLDGTEAATIGPFDAPERIRQVTIEVDPGPAFRLGTAQIAPLAPGTRLPEGFAAGLPAPSPIITEAVGTAIDAWRAAGRPTARVAAQSLRADHRQARLDAAITLAPGPVARFGQLRFAGTSGVRPARLAKIAGFPTGRTFAPTELADVIDRLRRTGTFSAISAREADQVAPDGTLDVEITLVDQPRRRLGFGAEISNGAGLDLTAYLINRNLLGGAERLRIDAGLAQIAAPGSQAPDAHLGVSIDRPATLTPDTTLGLSLDLRREEDGATRRNIAGLEGRLSHILSPSASIHGGLAWSIETSNEDQSLGGVQQIYRTLSLPLGLTWDRRDTRLNARKGVFAEAEATLFRSYEGAGDDGLRLGLDLRGYQPLPGAVTAGAPIVLAGRVQAGAIVAADWEGTPRDYLFVSGGAGSVRGQPYESLSEPLCARLLPAIGTGCGIGGTHFLGTSFEVRAKLRGNLGAVAFADYGRIGVGNLANASALWHAGGGIGLRYDTGVGPIRLDLARPLGDGDTRGGLQIYLGIGQAF